MTAPMTDAPKLLSREELDAIAARTREDINPTTLLGAILESLGHHFSRATATGFEHTTRAMFERAVATPRLLAHIAALEAERDERLTAEEVDARDKVIAAAAYRRGLEDAALLVERIVVSGPDDDEIDHDDYRDTQIAAAIRALKPRHDELKQGEP